MLPPIPLDTSLVLWNQKVKIDISENPCLQPNTRQQAQNYQNICPKLLFISFPLPRTSLTLRMSAQSSCLPQHLTRYHGVTNWQQAMAKLQQRQRKRKRRKVVRDEQQRRQRSSSSSSSTSSDSSDSWDKPSAGKRGHHFSKKMLEY